MEDLNELKPCPFCGGQAELIREHRKGWALTGSVVRCKNDHCGCRGKWFIIAAEYSSDEKAIEAWNRRFEEVLSDLETKELITCADCMRWDVNDGTFKDIDDRQWHNCSRLGIETVESFFCKLAIQKGKKND